MGTSSRAVHMKASTSILLWAFLAVGCGQSPKVSDVGDAKESSPSSEGTVAPLSFIRPAEGDWRVEINLAKDDLALAPDALKDSRNWVLDDPDLLFLVSESWVFVKKGGDIATATSSLRVIKNGQQVRSYGLVLTSTVMGLQSREDGWMEAADYNKLMKDMSAFRRL